MTERDSPDNFRPRFRGSTYGSSYGHPAMLADQMGGAGTRTDDSQRNGTTTPFSALNVINGTVLGRSMQRHRHQEFIHFPTRAMSPHGTLCEFGLGQLNGGNPPDG